MNFIPLEKKRKSSFDFMNSSSNKRRRMKGLSFGGDSRILPRITELLQVSKFSRFTDEDQLLLNLRDTYPEYRRKKDHVLKAAIKKALGLQTPDRGNNNSDDGSEQGYVNEAEFSPDERYVAYEDVKFAKKSKSNQSKEYLQEKETVSALNQHMKKDVNNSIHTPKMYVVDKRGNFSRNAMEGTDIKDSEEQKSQKTPKILKKQEIKGPVPQQPTVTFSDIGGQPNTIVEISKVLLHLKFPKIFSMAGVKKPPCGILLHGPPGCGKTLLAHAIAGEIQYPLIEVAATDLVSGISGDSEGKIRNLFEQAVSSSPCILFIDEVDAITAKREFASKEMEKRIVSQLLKCMDDLRTKHVLSKVLVIGATNTPDALDPAFRRGGRFDQEIAIGIPDESARISILQVVCKDLLLSPNFDFRWLAKSTPGYVGADLSAVVSGAVKEASNRILQKLCLVLESDSKMQSKLLSLMKEAGLEVNSVAEASKEFLSTKNAEAAKLRAVLSVADSDAEPLIEKLIDEFHIEVHDFQIALDTYVPCAKREGFATVPSVTWADVGALREVQEALQKAIMWPVKYKEACDKYKFKSYSGMLLWGPKGCGKTLLAKAIANECGINFLSVKGPELLNMYVGESERAVRQVFQRARNSAPCVVLFDELDALCPPRSNSSGNPAADRVVNQLLTEMDGMEHKKQIFVLATTNRIENIDSAMLRPGRLEERVFVGLPTPEERADILKAITKDGADPAVANDVSLEALALDSRCDGFSGADLASLIRRASLEALKDCIASNAGDVKNINADISSAHFDYALSKMRPSVSKEERKYFQKLKLSEDGKS